MQPSSTDTDRTPRADRWDDTVLSPPCCVVAFLTPSFLELKMNCFFDPENVKSLTDERLRWEKVGRPFGQGCGSCLC